MKHKEIKQEAESKLEGISKEELKKIEEKEIALLTAKDYYTLGWDAIREGKFNTVLNEFELLEQIANGEQVEVDVWREKYADISLVDWSFDELYEWVDGVEDESVKGRLSDALEVFEGYL